jgi:hypothetical protein
MRDVRSGENERPIGGLRTAGEDIYQMVKSQESRVKSGSAASTL